MFVCMCVYVFVYVCVCVYVCRKKNIVGENNREGWRKKEGRKCFI